LNPLSSSGIGANSGSLSNSFSSLTGSGLKQSGSNYTFQTKKI
jgi:hypothetical protein